MISRSLARAAAWQLRWRPVLPVLVAEFIVVVGFGALLPVLPLYVTEQGVDTATLGIILAAWPAARLVCEPVFGWLADRTARKPLMLAGLAILAVASPLQLAFHAPLQLILLRFVSGAAASMYDPAARGILVDGTAEDERGEVFGLYSSAQMGGLIFGPVIGAFGTALGGGFAFPFLAAGIFSVLCFIYVAYALRPTEVIERARAPQTETSYADYGTDSPELAQRLVESQQRDRQPQAPLREMWNRAVVGAMTMNFALYLAIGVYEVIWSLYLQHLGAPLAWIGITYVLFATPVLLFSPFAGRLVDRLGGLRFALAGGMVVGGALFVYAFAFEPYLPGLVILVEATANAFLGPAMFAILARGTPAGRTSTTQGLFGAAGTVAFVFASVATGALFAIDVRYPFLVIGGLVLACFVAGGLIVHGGAVSLAVRGATASGGEGRP
ncbi:MAG: MFS transporter [Candidatus Limnocylindrales bacterium]